MDELMCDSDLLGEAAASLIDLANFGLPQVSDSLFETPSQENEQQVENTNEDSAAGPHVDSLETVFTNSVSQHHGDLEDVIRSELISVTMETAEKSLEEPEDTREPLNYEL